MIETEIKLLELELKTVIAELLDSKNAALEKLEEQVHLLVDRL